MSLGAAPRTLIAFTCGLPDAGSALTRKFVAPVSITPAAETDAGSQNNRRSGRTEQPCTIAGHRAAFGTYPIPSLTQPAASVTAAVRASRVKNARESTETTISLHRKTSTRSQDLRDIVSFLTESLGTPTKAIADSLTKQIKKAHSSFLDLQRQITAIKEKQSNKENPHGWKVREVPLGVNNAALEQQIVEEQHAAAQKILSLILSANLRSEKCSMREHTQR